MKRTMETLIESELALKDFIDILEQQGNKNASELQENHKLLESIYNTTQVGMSVFKPVYDDQNRITDFKIIIVNKRVVDASGRTDLPGKLYTEEFPGVKKTGLFELMVKTMETGVPSQMEYFYEHEGINRWYSTMYVKTDDILVCSNLDVTEQKLTQEQNGDLYLRQKELEERQQQEIFRAILDTQEAERKRIAENLHNSLGQILYAAKLSLSSVDKSSLKDSDRENIKNADRLLNDAITESRRLSHELMPAILEDFGLKFAVEDICRKLSGKTQLKCRFKGSIKRLDKYIEIAIYRLVQELIMNTVKHSGATDALVAVEINQSEVLVSVRDNGRGFNITKGKRDGGIGLKTIHNNVNLLNGNIHITSKPGNGTVVNIDIPFKSDN